MSRLSSSFVVRAVLGCTLLAPASLTFVQAHAALMNSSVSAPLTTNGSKVNISTGSNTVTFKPNTDVAAVRVQITSAMGSQLYNSGWMTGGDASRGDLTWHTLDDKGATLPPGPYLTLVEVRDVDGPTKAESGSLELDAASVTPRSDVSPRATTITGAGTTNRLALWTSASTIGDSIVTQTSSSALSIAGSLTVNNTISTKTVNATNNTGNALVGNSKSGTALAGITQTGNGVLGTSTSALGVRGVSGTGIGVRGDSNNGTIGVQGNSTAVPKKGQTPVGVDGNANGDLTSIGVRGTSTGGYGVYGSGDYMGVYGLSTYGYGVYGKSTTDYGVYGKSSDAVAVVGESDNYSGVYGYSRNSYGVFGESYNNDAGYFHGNVTITGNLSKQSGNFRIDDPTDPAHKYLSHSFVESPDMMNLYNGTIVLDKQGRATVTMPAYFSALNRTFRYTLTPIGAPAPNLYVARKMSGNTWQIAGGKAGMEVSWMVTGVRKDPWANDHRIPTQQLKTGADRGHYLYPAGYHQPASMGIDHLVTKTQLPKLGVQQTTTKPTVKRAAPARVAQVK